MSKFRDYTKYEVYEDGRIYSYWTNKFLKPKTLPSGYQQVHLTDNEGNTKWYYIHRVVFETFSGSPIPKGYEINHIDEMKYNNARSNLELVSPKENCNFGTRNSRIAKVMTNGKLSKQVGAFNKNGELVMTFPSIMEAGRQGFCQSAVSDCCRNCYLREGNNVFKGFEWRYL